MRADLSAARPAPSDAFARPVRGDDRAAIAALMLEAYRATPDDAGEGPAEAAAEVDRLFDGAFGPFDAACSEVVTRDGAVVNATLVTRYQGNLLIAFSMTAPEWKRRGLARAGMLRTMDRCRCAGHREAFLAVTTANIAARRLYESLGFVEAPL